VKILIADDERLARERLDRLLRDIPGVEVVAEAGDGAATLLLVQEHRPDMLLLDINMPRIDGLAVAAQVAVPAVVFTTAHVQFAADAFDLDAVDYLMKPVRPEQLERAVERAKRRLRIFEPTAEHRLTVHTSAGTRFVDARRVTAFRALDKYTEFELDGEQLLVRDSLDALERDLEGAGFARAHRNVLVRRDAILGFKSSEGKVTLDLCDGSSVEVSRRRAPALRKILRS